MNIHEYQAKQILRQYGVPTSNGILILNKKEIDDAINNFDAKLYVVKAQIHAGGRGKAGGVKVLRNKEDAKAAAHSMINSKLVTHQTSKDGQLVKIVYVESGCDILKEYYFSVILDRASSCVTLMASIEGGVDIEEVAHNFPEKIIKIEVDPFIGLQQFHCRRLAFALGMKSDHVKQMTRIVESTYRAFIETDASQIEINPLVLTHDGKILALDAKINFDDNALFRHEDVQMMRDEDEEDPLETRAANFGLSYVKMDGNIGCMVNGAGLAMATMDIIKFYGAEPANFLDVGGGADKEKVTEAFKIILSDTSVCGILVNIFGGIMRCDVIAHGIIAAAKDVDLKVPLVVRLAGTNFELGQKILSGSGLAITPANDLADAASMIVAAVNG